MASQRPAGHSGPRHVRDIKLETSMKKYLSILLTLLFSSAPAFGQECRMSRAFSQPDLNARGGTTAVWADAENHALFFTEGLNVNTDGTRRSYSVDDFWGERPHQGRQGELR
jgi:hypothetical protein